MSDYQLRFGGIARLYGNSQSAALQQAHFCVIGIGGVGSWVAEALARNGVGQITLIDLDDLCLTNINRQIHALTETVGLSKVDVMRDRIIQINPDCRVNTIEDFITLENIKELLSNSYGAGGQVDPSKIAIADLSQTFQDPLLAKVRNQLRREYNFSRNVKRKFAIDAVFSSEQLRYPDPDGNVCHAKQSNDGAMRLDCSGGFGAATHVTACFAFFAVGKAMDKYLKKALS